MPKRFAPVNAAQLANMNYSVNGSNASLVHSVIRNSDRTYGDVEIAALIPNPFQPRKRYNEEKLRGLAASIDENGLIEPIVVRRSLSHEGKLEIVCGERRVRATRDILHWNTIHAEILESCTDGEVHRIAVLENVQREDLSPMEVAAGYQALLNEKDEQNRLVYTIRSLGEKLGKNKDHIQEHVSLLSIPDEIQALLEQENPIPRRVALELADIEDVDERSFLIQEYQDGQLKTQASIGDYSRSYKTQQKEPSPQEEGATAQEEHYEEADGINLKTHTLNKIEIISPSEPVQEGEETQETSFTPQQKTARTARPKTKIALFTLREKLVEQDKQIQKIVDKYNTDFPDMTLDERKLVISFTQQWQQLFQSFASLQ